MRSSAICLVSLAPVIWLSGCDIFALDNYDPPESILTGQLVFEGQPVGVRNGGVELELWQPDFDLDQKIPVHVDQGGTFQAALFDGDYELNLLPGNGPWIDDPTRIPVQVRGETVLDVEVRPYYVIRDEQIVNSDGTIEATFSVGLIDTSRTLEHVGLYVGRTTFVDQINQEVGIEVPSSELGSLDAPVRLSVDLPDDIHETPSPDAREDVFVRVGIKTAGIAEMLFTQVHKIGI